MSKYYDINNLPTGPITFILQERREKKMMLFDDDLQTKRKLKVYWPYDEIVDIYIEKYKLYGDFVAWVYTDKIGYDVVVCEYNGNDDTFEWCTDWYEGGDCYLLALAPLDDVKPTIEQKWEGYKDVK